MEGTARHPPAVMEHVTDRSECVGSESVVEPSSQAMMEYIVFPSDSNYDSIQVLRAKMKAVTKVNQDIIDTIDIFRQNCREQVSLLAKVRTAFLVEW